MLRLLRWTGLAMQQDAAQLNRPKLEIMLYQQTRRITTISATRTCLTSTFTYGCVETLRDVYPDIFAVQCSFRKPLNLSHQHIVMEVRKRSARSILNRECFKPFHEHLASFVLADYPQTVYYAFKQQDAGFLGHETLSQKSASTGWETMLSKYACGRIQHRRYLAYAN